MNDIMITCKCPMCGAITYVPCTFEQYSRYMDTNALIQDVFPDMDIHTRETIISGMCKLCQDKFFVEEDEDEEDDCIPCDGVCTLCSEGDTCPWSHLS